MSEKTEQPRVDVLVINWNGREHLEACFDSLCAQTWTNARFILVDNASSDDSVNFVQTRYAGDERVSVWACPENLGWSGGNNVALRRVLEEGTPYAILLNNDTRVAPDALEHLVCMAESDPGIGGLSPRIAMFNAPEYLNSIGLTAALTGSAWDRGIGRLDGPNWHLSQRVLGVSGAAFFLRTEPLARTGLLPEDFDIYLDDLDLSLRLWNAGYSLHYCPRAQVWHKFSATMGKGRGARRKYYLNTRNRFRIILRHWPALHWRMIARALVRAEVKAVGRALLDRAAWRVLAHARAWFAALTYIPQACQLRRQIPVRGVPPWWDLVDKDLLFCPGYAVPERGWYAPVRLRGRMFEPMGARAERDVRAGRLRVTLTNCYPQFGAADVVVYEDGEERARLTTRHLDEAELTVSAGTLTFEARRVFFAEDTGALADYGGWLRVEPALEVLERDGVAVEAGGDEARG